MLNCPSAVYLGNPTQSGVGFSHFGSSSTGAVADPLNRKGNAMKRNPFDNPQLGDQFEFEFEGAPACFEVVRVVGSIHLGVAGQEFMRVPVREFQACMIGLKARYVGQKSS